MHDGGLDIGIFGSTSAVSRDEAAAIVQRLSDILKDVR